MIARQLALLCVEVAAWAINTTLDALAPRQPQPDPLTAPEWDAAGEPTPHGDEAWAAVAALRDMRIVLDAVETVDDVLYLMGEDT